MDALDCRGLILADLRLSNALLKLERSVRRVPLFAKRVRAAEFHRLELERFEAGSGVAKQICFVTV